MNRERLATLSLCVVFMFVFSGEQCNDKSSNSSSRGGGQAKAPTPAPAPAPAPAPPPAPAPLPKPAPPDTTKFVDSGPAPEPAVSRTPATAASPKEEARVAKTYVPPPMLGDTPPTVEAPRYKTVVGIPGIVGTSAEFADKGKAGTGSKGMKPLDDEIDSSRMSASVAAPSGSTGAQLELIRAGMSDNAHVREIPSIEDAMDPREKSKEFTRSAILKMRLKDYPAALADATKAIALDPKNAEAYVARAKTYAQMKDYAQAERDAQAAVTIDARYVDGWHTLAWTQLQQGKYKDAVASATRAIELAPDDASNYVIRAYAKERLGDHEGALEDLRRASRLDDRYKDKYRRAKAGEKIFDAANDDSFGLLDDVASGGRRRGFGTWFGALALLLAGCGWVFWAFLRRREKDESGTWRKDIASAQAAPVADDGRLAGKYEVLRLIGRGGMGEVSVARDHSLGRDVALKRISGKLAQLDSRGREKVLAEAKTVAALHHPAIVDIYEVFDHGQDLCMVFELLKGKTVQELLLESKKFAPARALELLRPVCQALAFAHGKGLVHRDLKPSNIMLAEGGFVKLMDFGIARAAGSGGAPSPSVAAGAPAAASALFGRTTTVAGTPAYMPPEAERVEVRPESDVYSLGVCLYEMLTGAQPFAPPASITDKMEQNYLKPSLRDATLGTAFDDLIAQALQPDPEKRLKTASEFLARLEAAVEGKA